VQVRSRYIVISEETPVLRPATRDFVLMCTETKGREFSHGRPDGWKDLFKKFWNRKAADGGNLRDWWNVRMVVESCIYR
jgi:hypothetical protein